MCVCVCVCVRVCARARLSGVNHIYIFLVFVVVVLVGCFVFFAPLVFRMKKKVNAMSIFLLALPARRAVQWGMCE